MLSRSCQVFRRWPILVLLTLAAPARADKNIYVGAGALIGGGWFGQGGGEAAILELEARRQPHAFILRYVAADEGPSASRPLRSNQELALLYGWGAQGRYWVASTTLGVAGLSTVRRGAFLRADGGFFGGSVSYYETVERKTVGVAFQGGMCFCGQHVGLDLQLAADFNPIQSFGGLFLGLRVGRLAPGEDLASVR
jgi:hypothetical protein